MRTSDWSSDVCSSERLTHPRERGEFVEDVLDLDRGDRRALERGQKTPAQRIAERQAEAALQRFGDEGRLAPAVARDLDFKAVGLLQFLPVLHVDSHVFPLGMRPKRSKS